MISVPVIVAVTPLFVMPSKLGAETVMPSRNARPIKIQAQSNQSSSGIMLVGKPF